MTANQSDNLKNTTTYQKPDERNIRPLTYLMLSRLLLVLTIVTFSCLHVGAQTCPSAISNNSFTITPATCAGTIGTLKGSVPTGGNGTYNYQWHMSVGNCGNGNFQPIQGATAIDYAVPANATDNCYRRVVTSGSCTSTSMMQRFDPATSSTTPPPPTVTVIQPILTLPTGTITVTNPTPGPGVSYSIDGNNYTNTTGIFALLSPGNYNVAVKLLEA